MIMNVFILFWSFCVVNYRSITGCFVAKIEMANIVCVIVETNLREIFVAFHGFTALGNNFTNNVH